MSVFDARSSQSGAPLRMQVNGEIWAREADYVPVRITLAASQGEGASLIREEASVDYAASQWGALVPRSAGHRELRAGNLVAENRFEYSSFRLFSAK